MFLSEVKTFTFSALVDILKNSFSICRTSKFPRCGDYYYNEIKEAKWENRTIRILESSLNVLNDIINDTTITNKKKIITRALRDFTFYNMPDIEAENLCKDMRWKIVE